jgi:GTPase SAR1 family protein
LLITQDSTTKVIDGAYGMVFPWLVSNESFNPKLNDSDPDWAKTLFSSALDNLLGIDKEDALALLNVWVLFLIFRSMAVSRPILAAFGQPGAGKSTLFRRLYRLLYGRQKSVLKITNSENFDMALVNDPFVACDNVDSPERWLPDRLALAASSADVVKRKLYTDADEYVQRCQALVGITAHNPRFTREDVSDRLILLTFKRLENFLPEGDILDAISTNRNRLWGGIVLDCQRVLSTPYPMHADVPQFRVEDFARTGHWIAIALGLEDHFRRALEAVSRGTKALNLNEDQVLVDAIRIYIERGKYTNQWRTPGQLWNDLQILAPDSNSFAKLYRGSVYLGKKLLVLQDSLKELFDAEVDFDKSRATRLWKFGVKDGEKSQSSVNGLSGTTTILSSSRGSSTG